MRLTKTWGTMAASVLAVVAAAAAAPGDVDAQESARYVTGSISFGEREPGRLSSVRLEADFFDPSDPDAKPPAVRTGIFQFAQGTVIDTDVPEKCTASDQELMASGQSACPAGSQVGQGEVVVDTGFPGPSRDVPADMVALNNTDELILVGTARDTGLTVIVRAQFKSPSRFDATLPLIPGTPPSGASLDYVKLDLPKLTRAVGGVTRNYITTPSSCDGAWVNTADLTFDDGVKQFVETRSPCEPAPSQRDLRPGRCANAKHGTSAADELFGTSAGDLLRGGDGDDVIRAGPGDDCLFGGAGHDALSGGVGDDRIWARDGSRDLVRCGRGRDWVKADRIDSVRGCEKRAGRP